MQPPVSFRPESSTPRALRPVALRPVVLCAAALLSGIAGGALAQSGTARSPYYFGGSVSLAHDTNVLRAPSGQAQSDTYTTLSVLAGVDQTISRQRVYGDVALRTTRYGDLTQLNGEGYGLNLGLDWATIGRLSGTLRASANQTQARFTDPNLPFITSRNDERTQQFLAMGRWGLAQLFEVEGSYTFDRLDYSNALAQTQNLEQQIVGLGVRYSPSALLTLGIGARGTSGQYPRFYSSVPGTGSPLDFDRSDVDLSAVWVPSGATRLEARLSSTRVDYDQDPARDVSGVTGSLTWGYTPTGRTRFTTTVFRDTGAAATFQQIGTVGTLALGDTSQLSTGLRLGVNYAVTAKITATANVGYSNRDYAGALGGSEDITNLGLGLSWEATRAVNLGCSIGQESRDSSTPLSFSYRSTLTMCTARIVLR